MKPIIKPLGVGVLKIVRQRIARYEAREVAHIENVLEGENRSREHRRLRRVEELVEFETTREEESKRDLQSTERFELQREVERSSRSELRAEAGLNVSASYGPVQLSAFGRIGSATTQEESNKSAERYAKELVEKSTSRILEKTRELRRRTEIDEVEEKNTHGFSAAQRTVGIYRWVDKIYRAKVVNYGKRLLYEFIVPEPASYYVWSQGQGEGRGQTPKRPDRPTVPMSEGIPLSPASISRSNYQALIEQYGVEGVEPPLPEHILVPGSFSRSFQAGELFSFTIDDLKVPKNYKAQYLRWTTLKMISLDGLTILGQFSLLVGQTLVHSTVQSGGGVEDSLPFGSRDISELTSFIPVSGTGNLLRELAVNFEVLCKLEDTAFERWQLSVFSAVMAAYRRAVSEFEDQVNAAQVKRGGLFGASNPDLNRAIEHAEMRRGALTLWTLDRDTNAVSAGPAGEPVIRLRETLAFADRAAFLEKAFEWENMTYEFLPYYWARRDTWPARLTSVSDDPVFQAFLQSGAARVIVPVRPEYAHAVLFYQLTEEIWPGGPVPELVGDAEDVQVFNGYLRELADESALVDVSRGEAAIDASDPATWLIRLPTTLVWLQPDGSELPDLERSSG